MRYLVEAILPSGDEISKQVELFNDEERSLELAAPESPHEWLSWQVFQNSRLVPELLSGTRPDQFRSSFTDPLRLCLVSLPQVPEEGIREKNRLPAWGASGIWFFHGRTGPVFCWKAGFQMRMSFRSCPGPRTVTCQWSILLQQARSLGPGKTFQRRVTQKPIAPRSLSAVLPLFMKEWPFGKSFPCPYRGHYPTGARRPLQT